MLSTTLGIEYPQETDTVTSYPAVAQQVAQWVDTRPGIARLATTAARDALAAPDLWTGKVIYNLATKTLQVYDPTNGNWSDIASTHSAVVTRSMLVSPTTGKLIGELVVRPGGISLAEAAFLIPADGAMVSSATWPLLDAHMAAVGYPYGHDAIAGTFGTPDVRDRVVLGATAAAPGGGRSARPEAQTGGEETHTLLTGEMPSHSHATSDTGHAHGVTDPTHIHTGIHDTSLSGGNNGWVAVAAPTSTEGTTGAGMATHATYAAPGSVATGSSGTGVSTQTGHAAMSNPTTGGSGAHNNMQPFIAIPVFIVAA